MANANPEDEKEALQQEPFLESDKKKKRKWIWLLCGLGLILVLAGIAVLLCLNQFALTLELEGEAEITAEAGHVFLDPGVRAEFGGTLLLRNPVEVQVDTAGVVDTGKLGTYTVTYTAEYVLNYLVGQTTFRQSRSRTVHVEDTRPPVITLVTSPDHYTLPGHIYEEEGFTAVDNLDGDITHLVERVETEKAVVYKVTDSSGNVAQIQREIVYSDPIPPVLTLKGESEVTILRGGYFADPGYTAQDNYDGDISGSVKVTGFVNSWVAGQYTLEYSVTDGHNNTTTVIRTITVANDPPMPELPPADAIPTVPPNGKVIYLTFDDGPSIYTERLLDILDRYGVKATFFVVNTGYEHLLSRMAATGHTVAIHSKTHDYYRIYASEDAYFDDLYEMQQIIYRHTGQTPTLVRFPGGSSNTVSGFNPGIMTRLTAKLKEMDYRYFDWNVDSFDVAGAGTAEMVFYNVANGAQNNSVSVVLQHDILGFSVEAVDMIIRWGLSNGYTFLPLNSTSPQCEHTPNN